MDYKDVLQTFLAETAEHLGEMEEVLISLEDHPGDEEAIKTIFRIAHTIKGNSSCMGMDSVAHFAHAFEDALAHLQDRSLLATGRSVALLLPAVDGLRQIVARAAAGDDRALPEEEALLARIMEIEDDSTEPTAPAAFQKLDSALARADHRGSLRVDTGKLDRMLNLASEMIIARGRLRQVLGACGLENREEVAQPVEAIDRLFLEFQDSILKIRMVPLSPIFRQYTRTVRDLAEATGKLARLVVEGGEAEVDTSVAEHLRDPLTHIIRNAIDHGIETPAARIQKGKAPCGRISVRANQQGDQIIIRISDDGAGLNRDRIIEQARLRGIIADPSVLTDQAIHRLILQPGFSTAERVTEISGRGVGMDVVCRNIEAIRGSVEISTHSGEGTTITIRLPLTLAIIDGFVVGVGDETYVIPVDSVTGCLELVRSAEPGGLINLRGEAVPYVRLRKLFRISGDPPERESLIIVRHEAGQAGFAVDDLYGEGQVVIKPLGKLFKQLVGVSGSTVLDNGRVALVLDIPALVQESALHYRSI